MHPKATLMPEQDSTKGSSARIQCCRQCTFVRCRSCPPLPSSWSSPLPSPRQRAPDMCRLSVKTATTGPTAPPSVYPLSRPRPLARTPQERHCPVCSTHKDCTRVRVGHHSPHTSPQGAVQHTPSVVSAATTSPLPPPHHYQHNITAPAVHTHRGNTPPCMV